MHQQILSSGLRSTAVLFCEARSISSPLFYEVDQHFIAKRERKFVVLKISKDWALDFMIRGDLVEI